MIRLLLATWPNSPHTNGDYDFAYLELTEEVAKRVRLRQQLVKQVAERDSDTHKIEFADDSVRYFTRNMDLETGDDAQLIEAMFDALQRSGCVEIEATALPAEYFKEDTDLEHETDCPRMVVSTDGVSWAAYPTADESVEIETSSLPDHILQRLL